jgi:putative N6-adenine-specific DNA methylase
VLLMLCRFDPRRDALVDPMCGSGTIPIEAVHMARATPRPTPVLQSLGITYRMPDGPADGSAPPLYPDASPLVLGCDIDLDVLAAARDNARAARCADAVTWQRADVAHLTPQVVAAVARERGRDQPRSGLLVANPPYGERLDEGDLRAIYRDLAETCRRFVGWRVGLLVGNPFLEEVFQRILGRPRIKKPLANANLRAYFYLYEL